MVPVRLNQTCRVQAQRGYNHSQKYGLWKCKSIITENYLWWSFTALSRAIKELTTYDSTSTNRFFRPIENESFSNSWPNWKINTYCFYLVYTPLSSSKLKLYERQVMPFPGIERSWVAVICWVLMLKQGSCLGIWSSPYLAENFLFGIDFVVSCDCLQVRKIN